MTNAYRGAAMPLARNSDPSTSHEAAACARKFADDHKQVIREALAEHGPMTSEQIAGKTGLSYHAVARRISELRPSGRVVFAGVQDNRAGRAVNVWGLCNGGQQ